MRALICLGFLLAQDPDIDLLLKQLADESIEVREKAAAALVELGPAAEQRLAKEAATAQGELKSKLDTVLFALGHRRRRATVLPPVRFVTLEAKDRPLKEVFDQLKAKSGLTLKLAASGESRVSVQLRDALPIEALDAICRAAGIGYGCANGTDLVIEGKYPETPRAFVGWYAVSAAAVTVLRSSDFEKSTGAAILDLALFWPADVRPIGQTSLEVTSATDDAGESLMWEGKAPASGQATSLPEVRAVIPHRLGSRVWLKGPSKGATKIASLKGRMKLSYSAAHFISFAAPEGDQKLEYDGVTLDLKNFSHRGETVSFSLDLAGRRRNAGATETRWCYNGGMRMDGHDKIFLKAEGEGESVPTEWSGGPTETGWRLNFVFKGIKAKAAAIRMEVDGVQFEDVVDFELKDIPLPK